MNTHPEHIRFEQEKRLQAAITNICEFFCLEMAARHGDPAFHHKVPPDIDTFVSVLQTVIAGIASTIQAAPSDSDPPTPDEAPRPDPGLPPSREEQAKSVGRFLELDAESRVRIRRRKRSKSPARTCRPSVMPSAS